MELEILRKKLSTFRTESGSIRGVSDDVLLEVLHAWENWPGTSKDFYRGLGSSRTGMASMIGKAKRLKREGVVLPFKEVIVEGVTDTSRPHSLTCDIEVQDGSKLIRFRNVDFLIEYLKKAA